MARNDEYDYLIRLLALGDQDVGKTTFLYYYTDGKFDPGFTSTIGVDFRQKRIIHRSIEKTDSCIGEEQILHLQLWDTAGQERFRSLCSIFFRDAMGFVLMFDLTNADSLLNIREWMNILKANAYCDQPDIILVGNKADLPRTVTEEAARKVAQEFNLPYIETSALNGIRVEEAMDKLVNMVMTRIENSITNYKIANPSHTIVLKKDKNKSKNDSSCPLC